MQRELPNLQIEHLLALMAAQPERYPFLLESTAVTRASKDGALASNGSLPLNDKALENARYSLLMGFPQRRIQQLAEDGSPQTDFLTELNTAWRSEYAPVETDLPFAGGWFLYFAYEFAAAIETHLNMPQGPEQLLACAVRIPFAFVIDHQQNQAWAVCESKFSACMDAAQDDLAQIQSNDALSIPEVELGFSPDKAAADRYLENVQTAQRYIRDGDIFQANLSRPWCSRQGIANAGQAVAAYKQLAKSNPAAFAGLALLPEQAVISSSPERLVSIRKGLVNTRPIAGTHPRGQSLAEDANIAKSLLAHPKEQAEHIMLIDLERNDLGRVCQPGTVRVDELMAVESYAYVHHIVSSVSGELAQGQTPIDVIRATFPGGTITGCPKVRCMEIIAELEQQPRGAYTGSMGYLNHNGDMDLNILIRTVDVDMRSQQVSLRAGAGIVADSVPEKELAETAAKAKGLLKAFSGNSHV